MKLIRCDVFDLDPFKAGGKGQYELIYADPPYANCRFRYARGNGSRQWGRHARADFIRKLVALMDSLRSAEGVCAVSMSSNELRLLYLFPTEARVMPWVKPYAPFRPHVWPCYAWEPLVVWGKMPGRKEQLEAKTPHDWLMLSPQVPKKGGHETPKPLGFAEWVINMTLGPRRGNVLELFAGTCPVASTAEKMGMDATAIDLDDYSDPQGNLLMFKQGAS
jgi:hypothetical protein